MDSWVDTIVKLTPAFFTLVIGTVATGIAFLQYRISRDKLRLDLFSKRLEAYEKLQEFFNILLRDGRINGLALPVLSEARYKSRFLFGPEIEGTFDTLWKKAIEMRMLNMRLYGEDALPVGPERSVIAEKESKLLGWMMDQMTESPKRYARYLHFK